MHGYIQYCCLQLDSRPITINLSTSPKASALGPVSAPFTTGALFNPPKRTLKISRFLPEQLWTSKPRKVKCEGNCRSWFCYRVDSNNSFKAVPGKPFQVGNWNTGFFTISMSVSSIGPIGKTFENFSYGKELPPWQVWCHPKSRKIWILRLLWGQLSCFHPFVLTKSHSVTHDLGQNGSCLDGALPILGAAWETYCLITTHIFPQKIGLPVKHRTRLNSTPQSNRGKALYLCALYILRVYVHVSMRGGAF